MLQQIVADQDKKILMMVEQQNRLIEMLATQAAASAPSSILGAPTTEPQPADAEAPSAVLAEVEQAGGTWDGKGAAAGAGDD